MPNLRGRDKNDSKSGSQNVAMDTLRRNIDATAGSCPCVWRDFRLSSSLGIPDSHPRCPGHLEKVPPGGHHGMDQTMKKDPDFHPHNHQVKVVMTEGTEFFTYSTYGQEGDTITHDIDPK